SDDEDDARSALLVRPGLEMDGGVDQMLDAVNGDRCRQTGDIENAFDPQDIISMCLEQKCEPDAESRPVDRTLEGHGEGMYARIMLTFFEVPNRVARYAIGRTIMMIGLAFGG